MSFAAPLAWKNLWRRPSRTLFSVLGVALGIATVVAIFTVDHNTVLFSQPSAEREPWRADLEVTAKAEVDDPRGALEAVEGVAASTPVAQGDLRLVTTGEDAKNPADGRPVRLVALDPAEGERMGLYRIEAGAPIDPGANRPQVLVGRRLADELGLVPGTVVGVGKLPRPVRKVCVEGQMVEQAGSAVPRPRPVEVVGVLAFENLGREANGDVLVGAVEALGPLVQAPAAGRFWVARQPEVDLERFQSLLSESFAFDLRRGAAVGQQADERAFRNGVLLAGLMAMALGLFVIFHTLSMSLVERVREVGLLNALGASRAQIGRLFFAEAVLISLLAGALGLGGGIGLGHLMLQNGISSLGITDVFKNRPLSIPWEQIVPLTLLGMLIALAGSIYPLLKAGRADTVAALRGEEDGDTGLARGFHLFSAILVLVVLPATFFFVVDLVGEESRELLGVVLLGIGVLALLLGTPLLVPGLVRAIAGKALVPLERFSPCAGLLTGRTLVKSPVRIAASVAAIALVTAAFVGLRGMTRSLWLETDVWAKEAAVDKLWVERLAGLEWQPFAEALREEPGVIAVEPGSHMVQAPFRVVGLNPEELARYGPLASDTELLQRFRAEQGMIVSRRLAKQRGVEVGDVVPLPTPGSGVRNFEVIAISDAYGYFPMPHERVYGVIASEHMFNDHCLDTERTNLMAIVLAPGTPPEGPIGAVRRLLGEELDPGFRIGSDVRDYELRDIRRDFLVFDVILLLTAALAGLGVLNGQLLSALERAKELGVLRALGASPSQIAASVHLESLVIGLTGGLLGLALGTALVPVVVKALRVLSGLDLPQPGTTLSTWGAPLAAVALALAAGLYPILRMQRMDPVRAVRTG